jgi:hypothetical protein
MMLGEAGTPVKVLCMREPWLWAMLELGKDIENRKRCLGSYVGDVLLQRSVGTTEREVEDAFDWMARRGLLTVAAHANWPGLGRLEKGGIVARTRFTDLIRPGMHFHPKARSRWYMGQYGYVCEGTRLVPFVPYKGHLGLRNAPPHLLLHEEPG